MERSVREHRQAAVALGKSGKAGTCAEGRLPRFEFRRVEIVDRKPSEQRIDFRRFLGSAPFVDEVVDLALRAADADDEIRTDRRADRMRNLVIRSRLATFPP